MSDPTNMPTRSDAAQARSFLWRFLGAAFTYPEEAAWEWLRDPQTCALLKRAQAAISPALAEPLEHLLAQLLSPRSHAEAQNQFLRTFGATVKGDCPPHEIEYGELRADPFYQPHRLADIAAFYSAFGLEVADDADERVDHIAMECEFFSVLCAKEAAAIAEGSDEHRETCAHAQRQFLREHLGRWTPAFARRLSRHTDDSYLRALAAFLHACVNVECERAGIQAGNDDLKLRPAEPQMDPCGQCGLAGLATAENRH